MKIYRLQDGRLVIDGCDQTTVEIKAADLRHYNSVYDYVHSRVDVDEPVHFVGFTFDVIPDAPDGTKPEQDKQP